MDRSSVKKIERLEMKDGGTREEVYTSDEETTVTVRFSPENLMEQKNGKNTITIQPRILL